MAAEHGTDAVHAEPANPESSVQESTGAAAQERGDPPGGRWRSGGRAGGAAVLAVSLLVILVPLVALPAARCAALGLGCPDTRPRPPATVPTVLARRPLTPVEAATRGRYVALGDSYASGEGAYGGAADLAPGNRCHRTSKAYFHAVIRTFRFAGGSAFWACSGATVQTVLHGKSGEPGQTGRVDTRTSLVTLSVGGNDVGFSTVLAGCVLKLPMSGGCREQADRIAVRLATLRRTLPAVLKTLSARAPSARILVLGYPRIFAETSGAGFDNIAIADQQWLNARARDLDELIRQAVAEADRRIVAAGGAGSVEFVDAYSGFAGHEIGTADPFVNGLDVDLATFSARPRSFHPTASGYERLAGLFEQQIRTGPGRPLNQFR